MWFQRNWLHQWVSLVPWLIQRLAMRPKPVHQSDSQVGDQCCFLMGMIREAHSSRRSVSHLRALKGASLCCEHRCVRQNWEMERNQTMLILLSQCIKPHPKPALILCFSIRWNNKSPLMLKPVCVKVSVLCNESIWTNANVSLRPSGNRRRQSPRWY